MACTFLNKIPNRDYTDVYRPGKVNVIKLMRYVLCIVYLEFQKQIM